MTVNPDHEALLDDVLAKLQDQLDPEDLSAAETALRALTHDELAAEYPDLANPEN